MRLDKKAVMEFSLSGFLIAMVLVGLFVTGFTVFISGMTEEYSLNGTSTLLENYNITKDITADIEEIRNETNIEQETDWLDVIGGYFSGGYKALKTSVKSISLFNSLVKESEKDVPFFSRFGIGDFLITLILIGILIGILASVLVKMRI